MIIISEDKKSSIQIDFLEKNDVNQPSIRVRIKIVNYGFTGIKDVWIEKINLDKFIKDCKEFLDSRKGKLKLESMNPGEFIINIENWDNLGHCELRYSMTEEIYDPCKNKINFNGGFSLDSEMINKIINDIDLFYKQIFN